MISHLGNYMKVFVGLRVGMFLMAEKKSVVIFPFAMESQNGAIY